MQQSGAQIVMDVLREQGTDVVFGYPGSAVLELYDALYRRPDIRHILTAHEQAAAHAADGYARASGKTGVVFATSGPGATNLVTGIAAAHMDSAPMVAITGNVRTQLLGSDAFQEVDIAGVTMPLTKYSFLVRSVDTLAADLREAFQLASSGRKGPVLLDLPMDVAAQQAEYSPAIAHNPTRETVYLRDERLLRAIVQAKRPLILAGGGATDAAQPLRRLAEQLHAPVICTLMGLGVFPARHPQFFGMAGLHGSAAANAALRECDLLVAVGTRFSDRVAQSHAVLSPGAKLLHIDIDEAELHKNLRADFPLCGDAAELLREIRLQLEQFGINKSDAESAQSLLWKPSLSASAQTDSLPRRLLSVLRDLCEPETIFVTDVGQHQLWAAHNLPVDVPRHFITTGGLGAMGFGMGAAVGASLACPGKRVVLITGDGSFHMNCVELATLRSYGLPVTVFVFNNGALGLVRQWQAQAYGERYSQSEPQRATDYVILAEAFGIKGLRLTDPKEAPKLFRQALCAGEPVVVDCPIPRDSQV